MFCSVLRFLQVEFVELCNHVWCENYASFVCVLVSAFGELSCECVCFGECI
jgi:hypothetical protein